MSASVQTLELFNSKVQRLRSGRFAEGLKRHGFSVTVDYQAGGPVTTTSGPDEDAFQAAVLTLRYFIQDNEPCSLRNLAKIYQDKRIPTVLREQYAAMRDIFNIYMDSEEVPSVHFVDDKLTLRKIFMAHLYGDLAHASPQHVTRFRRLEDGSLHSAMAKADFVKTLFALFNLVVHVAKLNREVLEKDYLSAPEIG